MFTLDVPEENEVINLHFVHHRSKRADAIPLLFAHGWPGNFTEVENILTLTDPEDPKQQAFHIVAPSSPGFVFSSSPKVHKPLGFPAENRFRLSPMIKPGYPKYIGQGNDFGSFILRSMALEHPESCVGIHVNYVFALPPTPFKNPLTYLQFMFGYLTGSDLRKDLDCQQRWLKEESAYTAIHGTKSQTIFFSLMDSPVGLLAWIREKINEWTIQNSCGTQR